MRRPPKGILKPRGGGQKKGIKAKFNQDVMVHEIESFKIYNVDMGKEAKKNFRRESSGSGDCALI